LALVPAGIFVAVQVYFGSCEPVAATGAYVEREYDIFEQLADGSPMWRGRASGLHAVRQQLLQLSKITKNECFAMHLPTKEIVARVNVRTAEGRKPLLFQISYDLQLAKARAEALRLHGYEVLTAFGNDAAKVVLALPQNYDVFIVGHAAPEPIRREMVDWLKANYPGVRIIALNPPAFPKLDGADYNLKLNGPETLLPVIAAALSRAEGASSVAGY
jgi:hypothetical protein